MNVKELLQSLSKSAEFSAAVLGRAYAAYVPEFGCAYSTYNEFYRDTKHFLGVEDIISISDAELERVPEKDINKSIIREGADVAVFRSVYEYNDGEELTEKPLTVIIRSFPVPGIHKDMSVKSLVKAVAKANGFYRYVFGKPCGVFDNGLQWIYASYRAFSADVGSFMMWDRSDVTEYMNAECTRCAISPGDFPLLINYGEPVAAFRASFALSGLENDIYSAVLYILHPGVGLQKGNGNE